MRLETKLLAFEIDEKGKNAGFVLKGKEDEAAFGSDFFRLILDDGMRTEIPILSSMQEGKATFADDKIVVTYDSLISEYGDTYNIKFTLTVEIEDGLLKFTPAMTNGTTDIRINECMCPPRRLQHSLRRKVKGYHLLPMNSTGSPVPSVFSSGYAQAPQARTSPLQAEPRSSHPTQ